MNRTELLTEMEKFGLDEDSRQKISAHFSCNVYYKLQIDLEATPGIGDSKIGGVPDLPKNGSIVWPEPDNKPFKFIAQINLKDLADKDARLGAHTGILYFFILDQGYPIESRVIFSPTHSDLAPSARPEMMPEMDVPKANAISLIKCEDWIPPAYESDIFETLDLTEDQKYAYEDFEYEVLPELDNLTYEGCYFLSSLTQSAVIALGADVAPAQSKDEAILVLLGLDPFEDDVTLKSALDGLRLGRRLIFGIRVADLKNMKFEEVLADLGES